MANNLMREYVAGGGDERIRSMRQALPYAFDDVTRDFGDDIYERMALDPIINASITALKSAVLEEGVKVTPALDNKDSDGYELAVELADLTERTLDDLETPMDGVLYSMLDSMPLGSKIAEMVYEDATVNGKRILRLKAIKPKPRQVISFVVDEFWNVLGFANRSANQYGLASVDKSEILPRHKFCSMTFRMKDNDPRGTSIYRPVYNPWWLKMQTWPEYLKYLAQFASPGLIGITSPDAANYEIVDLQGNVISVVTPQEAMVTSLANYRNGAVLAFPHGTSMEVIASTGEGQAFLSAIGLFDSQIVTGILTQTMATMEGKHQSRAAAQVHQDVLGTLIRQAKRSTVRMIRRDIVRPFLLHNYGEKALALLPKVSLGSVEKQDLATTITALSSAGYALDSSQFPSIDQLLNLPPRMLPDRSQQPVSESDETDGNVD